MGWLPLLPNRFQSKSSLTENTLNAFREAQHLAYGCVFEIASTLEPDITEIDAADLLLSWLQENGVKNHFHRPLAWFGERAAFQGMRSYKDYLPSNRILKKNDIFILDVAPIVNGYVGDVGFTFSLEHNTELEHAKASLNRIRKEIPSMFEEDVTLKHIWQRVENMLLADGYENCYRRYPFSVLGHRVYQIPRIFQQSLSLPVSMASWFSLPGYVSLLSGGVLPDLIRPHSHKKNKVGLWAIEPHLGTRPGTKPFGAKFEEILVVTPGKAYWLDEQGSLR